MAPCPQAAQWSTSPGQRSRGSNSLLSGTESAGGPAVPFGQACSATLPLPRREAAAPSSGTVVASAFLRRWGWCWHPISHEAAKNSSPPGLDSPAPFSSTSVRDHGRLTAGRVGIGSSGLFRLGMAALSSVCATASLAVRRRGAVPLSPCLVSASMLIRASRCCSSMTG